LQLPKTLVGCVSYLFPQLEDGSVKLVYSKSIIKRLGLLSLGVALATWQLLGGANAANAGPMTTVIEASIDGGGTWSLVASGVTFATNPLVTLGTFTFTNVQAIGTDGPAEITSSTFSLTHAGIGSNSILVEVTSSGFTSPTTPPPVSVTSSVSGINPGGLTSLTFQSWVDQANRTDHTASGSSLTPGLQSGFPLAGSFNNTAPAYSITTLGSPFSLTHLFNVTMTGPGAVLTLGGHTSLSQQNGTPPPSPEPATLALFGFGILGMAGYGWKNRRKVAAA
jgi:hypothetical protein